MALTLPTGWADAMVKTGAAPRYYLRVSASPSVDYDFLSGACETGDLQFPASILSVSSISQELDPLTREFSISTVEVRLAMDPGVRAMVVGYRLKGKECLLRLGERSLGYLAFQTIFRGYIDEFTTSRTELTLTIASPGVRALDANIVQQSVYNVHPLEGIEDLLLAYGVPSADIELSTFDPDTDTDISHFCVSRGRAVSSELDTEIKGETLGDVVQQLCQLMYGGLVVREAGKIEFLRFDASASNVDTWTNDHILEIEVQQMPGRVVNRVSVDIAPEGGVSWGHSGLNPVNGARFMSTGKSGSMGGKYQQQDTTAQAASGDGTNSYVASYEISNPWLMGIMLSTGNPSYPDHGSGLGWPAYDAADTAIDFYLGLIHGVSGMRDSWPTGSQPAAAKISAGRPIHIKLQTGEIVRSTNFSPSANLSVATDPPSGAGLVSAKATATVARSQLNTTARDLRPQDAVDPVYARDYNRYEVPAYDVTIAKFLCDQIIERFAYGVPILRVRTTACRYAVQVGDFVGLDTDFYVDFARDGASSADKWEVIQKEDDLLGDSPAVIWTLALAQRNAGPSASFGYILNIPPQVAIAKWRNDIAQAISAKSILEGVAAVPSGLRITFDPGTVLNHTGILPVDSFQLTPKASSYNYASFDAMSGLPTIAYSSVALTEFESAGALTFYSFLTDGSGVTATTDLRESKTIFGRVVKDETIGPAHLISTQNTGLIPNSEFQIWSGLRTVATTPPDNWVGVNVKGAGLQTNWNIGGSTEVKAVTNFFESGEYGIFMKTSGATEPGLAIAQHIPVYPGAVYSWEANILNGHVGDEYIVRFYYTQGGGNPFSANLAYSIEEVVNASAAGTDFVRKTGRFVAAPPAGFGFISAVIAISDASPDAIIFDYFKIKREGTGINANRATTDQTVASGSDVVVQLNAEAYDYGAEFNTGTYKAVITEPGLYDIAANAMVGHLTGAEFARISIFKNGSVFRRGSYATAGGTNRNVNVNISLAGVPLDAGDEIQVAVDHNGAGTVYARLGASNTYLYIRKVD